jgi:septal ring factor EnvC (AmiA/AmiB activator)
MLAFLTHRLAGPIATFGCIALAIALFLAHRDLGHANDALADANNRNAELAADLGTARANASALEASLATQNGAVDRIATEAQIAAANAAKARAEAERFAEAYRRRADAIAAAKPEGADEAAAASDLIRKANTGGFR